MRKPELNRESFDQYLMKYFFNFLRRPGNHIRISNTKLKLNPEVKFFYVNAPNRNCRVSDDVWKDVIIHHLKKYNNQ